jgi:hypothetical protein
LLKLLKINPIVAMSAAPLTDSHTDPAFGIIGMPAAVPEYGQPNTKKAQAGFVIPTFCASRKLACLLHRAYEEPRYDVY